MRCLAMSVIVTSFICRLSASVGVCPSGLMPPDCRLKCRLGFYGNDCASPCPKTCSNSSCLPDSGACYGCETGFRGQYCSLACEKGFFGQGCNRTCPGSCFKKQCDPVTGLCNKCVPGYEGVRCESHYAARRKSQPSAEGQRQEVGDTQLTVANILLYVAIGVVACILFIFTIIVCVLLVQMKTRKTRMSRLQGDNQPVYKKFYGDRLDSTSGYIYRRPSQYTSPQCCCARGGYQEMRSANIKSRNLRNNSAPADSFGKTSPNREAINARSSIGSLMLNTKHSPAFNAHTDDPRAVKWGGRTMTANARTHKWDGRATIRKGRPNVGELRTSTRDFRTNTLKGRTIQGQVRTNKAEARSNKNLKTTNLSLEAPDYDINDPEMSMILKKNAPLSLEMAANYSRDLFFKTHLSHNKFSSGGTATETDDTESGVCFKPGQQSVPTCTCVLDGRKVRRIDKASHDYSKTGSKLPPDRERCSQSDDIFTISRAGLPPIGDRQNLRLSKTFNGRSDDDRGAQVVTTTLPTPSGRPGDRRGAQVVHTAASELRVDNGLCDSGCSEMRAPCGYNDPVPVSGATIQQDMTSCPATVYSNLHESSRVYAETTTEVASKSQGIASRLKHSLTKMLNLGKKSKGERGDHKQGSTNSSGAYLKPNFHERPRQETDTEIQLHLSDQVEEKSERSNSAMAGNYAEESIIDLSTVEANLEKPKYDCHSPAAVHRCLDANARKFQQQPGLVAKNMNIDYSSIDPFVLTLSTSPQEALQSSDFAGQITKFAKTGDRSSLFSDSNKDLTSDSEVEAIMADRDVCARAFDTAPRVLSRNEMSFTRALFNDTTNNTGCSRLNKSPFLHSPVPWTGVKFTEPDCDSQLYPNNDRICLSPVSSFKLKSQTMKPSNDYHNEARTLNDYHSETRPLNDYHNGTGSVNDYHNVTRPPNDYHNVTRPPNDYHNETRPPNDYHNETRPPNDYHNETRPPNDYHNETRPPNDYHNETRPPNDYHSETRLLIDYNNEIRPLNDYHNEIGSVNNYHNETRPPNDYHNETRPPNDYHNETRPLNDYHNETIPNWRTNDDHEMTNPLTSRAHPDKTLIARPGQVELHITQPSLDQNAMSRGAVDSVHINSMSALHLSNNIHDVDKKHSMTTESHTTKHPTLSALHAKIKRRFIATTFSEHLGMGLRSAGLGYRAPEERRKEPRYGTLKIHEKDGRNFRGPQEAACTFDKPREEDPSGTRSHELGRTLDKPRERGLSPMRAQEHGHCCGEPQETNLNTSEEEETQTSSSEHHETVRSSYEPHAAESPETDCSSCEPHRAEFPETERSSSEPQTADSSETNRSSCEPQRAEFTETDRSSRQPQTVELTETDTEEATLETTCTRDDNPQGGNLGRSLVDQVALIPKSVITMTVRQHPNHEVRDVYARAPTPAHEPQAKCVIPNQEAPQRKHNLTAIVGAPKNVQCSPSQGLPVVGSSLGRRNVRPLQHTHRGQGEEAVDLDQAAPTKRHAHHFQEKWAYRKIADENQGCSLSEDSDQAQRGTIRLETRQAVRGAQPEVPSLSRGATMESSSVGCSTNQRNDPHRSVTTPSPGYASTNQRNDPHRSVTTPSPGFASTNQRKDNQRSVTTPSRGYASTNQRNDPHRSVTTPSPGYASSNQRKDNQRSVTTPSPGYTFRKWKSPLLPTLPEEMSRSDDQTPTSGSVNEHLHRPTATHTFEPAGLPSTFDSPASQTRDKGAQLKELLPADRESETAKFLSYSENHKGPHNQSSPEQSEGSSSVTNEETQKLPVEEENSELMMILCSDSKSFSLDSQSLDLAIELVDGEIVSTVSDETLSNKVSTQYFTVRDEEKFFDAIEGDSSPVCPAQSSSEDTAAEYLSLAEHGRRYINFNNKSTAMAESGTSYKSHRNVNQSVRMTLDTNRGPTHPKLAGTSSGKVKTAFWFASGGEKKISGPRVSKDAAEKGAKNNSNFRVNPMDYPETRQSNTNEEIAGSRSGEATDVSNLLRGLVPGQVKKDANEVFSSCIELSKG